ncbi:hypothetical protein D039_2436B, partial [Vibrio parahaemolyticus EKP-028]
AKVPVSGLSVLT